jgi:uncharacterized membrane protein
MPSERQSPLVTPPSPRRKAWRRLFECIEGRLLALGLSMCLLLIGSIGMGLMLAPEATMKLASVIGLSLVIGIAAGISYGYAAGLGTFEVVACNIFVESLQVLLVYPLFLLAWQQLIDLGRMMPMLERLRAAAQSRQGAVRRWGIAGLFAFVFIPFWMTGPVVGAIMGFLLGFNPLLNLAIVLSASALGVVVYAALLGHLNAWASVIHPYAVFGTVVVLALAIGLARHGLRRPKAAGVHARGRRLNENGPHEAGR